jgi:serine/threonine protein phosphatase PrpC
MLDKILGRKRPTTEKTEPIVSSKNITPPSNEQSYKQLNWLYSQAQSVGCQREHNEDALFVFSSTLAYEDKQSFIGLFVVADGMGGHENGEVASSLAVHTFAEQVIGKVLNNFVSGQPGLEESSVKDVLLKGVQVANESIKKQVPGGGTTLTALLIFQHQLYVSHVGDSRAYLIPKAGEVEVLTHDHSFVRQLVDMGQISPEDAATHPQRNILSMALGQWDALEPEIFTRPVPQDGYLLVCSDGLWGVVGEDQLVECIRASIDPRQTCEQLMQMANEAGGPDNITAILIHIP